MVSLLFAAMLGFTVACSGDEGGDAAGAMPAATGGSQQAPAAGGSSAAMSSGAGTAPKSSASSAVTAAQPAAVTGAASPGGEGGAAASAAAGMSAPEPEQAAAAASDAAAGASGAPAAAGAPAQAAAGSGEMSAAGASGAAGVAGAPAVLTADGVDPLNPDWSKRMDLGKGDGSDVVTIGDSWMDYVGGGGGIQAGLDRAGTHYRHYALSGTTLLSGQIPSQYTQAKAINPDIKTVIMTGGGNDIMFSGGCNTTEACEMSVAQIQAGLDELWTQMAEDGVKDVIYIQYSADAGTAPKDTRPKETKPVPVCLTGKILCHSLATTELVMKQLVDGIHPTAQANDRIAAALIKLMDEHKMRR